MSLSLSCLSTCLSVCLSARLAVPIASAIKLSRVLIGRLLTLAATSLSHGAGLCLLALGAIKWGSELELELPDEWLRQSNDDWASRDDPIGGFCSGQTTNWKPIEMLSGERVWISIDLLANLSALANR